MKKFTIFSCLKIYHLQILILYTIFLYNFVFPINFFGKINFSKKSKAYLAHFSRNKGFKIWPVIRFMKKKLFDKYQLFCCWIQLKFIESSTFDETATTFLTYQNLYLAIMLTTGLQNVALLSFSVNKWRVPHI